MDSTGRTVRIVRAAFDRTLSSELIAAERAVQDSLLPPASVRDLREGVPVPELRPALDRLLVDDRGRVWLREHRGEYMALTGSGPRIWQLFDPSGAWLGRVEVPGAFTVHAIGADLVYGVEADAFGVEHPQARPLLSSPPPNGL